jgi:hypothetical protein
VKLNEILADGSTAKSTLSSKFDVFTQKYKHTGGIRSLNKAWPDDDVATHGSMIVNERQSMIQYLLSSTYRASARPNVVLQDKPRTGLFAAEAYARFKFKLFIVGKVSVDCESAQIPPKCFEVKCRVDGKHFYVRATQSKDDGINPSFYVNFVPADEATACVKWELVTCKGKDKAHLPFITNDKGLADGDEVTLPITWTAEKKPTVKRHVGTYDSANKKAKAE